MHYEKKTSQDKYLLKAFTFEDLTSTNADTIAKVLLSLYCTKKKRSIDKVISAFYQEANRRCIKNSTVDQDRLNSLRKSEISRINKMSWEEQEKIFLWAYRQQKKNNQWDNLNLKPIERYLLQKKYITNQEIKENTSESISAVIDIPSHKVTDDKIQQETDEEKKHTEIIKPDNILDEKNTIALADLQLILHELYINDEHKALVQDLFVEDTYKNAATQINKLLKEHNDWSYSLYLWDQSYKHFVHIIIENDIDTNNEEIIKHYMEYSITQLKELASQAKHSNILNELLEVQPWNKL